MGASCVCVGWDRETGDCIGVKGDPRVDGRCLDSERGEGTEYRGGKEGGYWGTRYFRRVVETLNSRD